MGLTGGGVPRVIVDGHCDEVAMRACSYGGNPEGLRGKRPLGRSQI